MILTDEQIAQDNERWKNRNLKAELRYCGCYIRERKFIHNDDLRFYAWLFRMALKVIEDMETKQLTELPQKYRAKAINGGAYFEGYYFQYPSTTVCFAEDAHLVETIHGLVTYRSIDYFLPNEPLFVRIDPNTLEVI